MGRAHGHSSANAVISGAVRDTAPAPAPAARQASEAAPSAGESAPAATASNTAGGIAPVASQPQPGALDEDSSALTGAAGSDPPATGAAGTPAELAHAAVRRGRDVSRDYEAELARAAARDRWHTAAAAARLAARRTAAPDTDPCPPEGDRAEWLAFRRDGAMATLRRHGLDEVTPKVVRWAQAMAASSPEDARAILDYLRERGERDETQRQAQELAALAQSVPASKRDSLRAGFRAGQELGKNVWAAGLPLAERLAWELDYAGHHYSRLWRSPPPRWLGGPGPGVLGLTGHPTHKVKADAPSLRANHRTASTLAGELGATLDALHDDAARALAAGEQSDVEDALQSLSELAGMFNALTALDEPLGR